MTVVILDFGGQYAHLISRRVRELGFRAETVPYDISLGELEAIRADAYILSGGPSSLLSPDPPMPSAEALQRIVGSGKPVLGICYGHQLLASFFGARLERREAGEYGPSTFRLLRPDPLFEGLPREFRVWMSHRDSVSQLPESLVALGETGYSPVAAFRHRRLKVYGLQFHPEVRHTEHGYEILGNFLRRVSSLAPDWSVDDYLEERVAEARRRCGGGNALIAVSGGVDSTTVALILLKALGRERVHLVFIDTGLLREGEAERAASTLRRLGFSHVHVVDAGETFLERLRGVTDPEEKRRVVAETFLEVLSREKVELEKRYGKFTCLAQGTIYPDRIETGKAGRGSAKIKSHHNVAMGSVEGLELFEPLRDLYKDEVRRLALRLGVPGEVVERHPFPGPGLAIRVVGEVTAEKLALLRKATRIVEEEFKRAGLYGHVWQAFPVLLPARSVGVKGDSRSYEYVLALRAVVSEDGMTASFARLPWGFLERLAGRLVNEVEGVNRVLYDITDKPPATIEYE